MTHFRIPDHLGICEVDGQLLLLDLRRDRYLLLDQESAASLRHWRAGPQAQDAGHPALSRLVARGLLVASDRPGQPGWTERGVPRRSLLDAHASAKRAWPLAPEVAACLWRARHLLKSSLESAVAAARNPHRAAVRGDTAAILGRFAAARRLIPVAPNCLLDSIALALFLKRRGVGCDLVFGVKLDPFAAHCWLEIGDAVANDAADSIATFTPILAA